MHSENEKHTLTLFQAVFGDFENTSELIFLCKNESDIRMQFGKFVRDTINNSNLMAQINDVMSRNSYLKLTSNIEENLDCYSKLIEKDDYMLSLDDLSMLAYSKNIKIIIFQKNQNNKPIVLNKAQQEINIYFDNNHGYHRLFTFNNYCLLEQSSYFQISFSREGQMRSYFIYLPLSILRNKLIKYEESLRKFDDQFNRFSEIFDLKKVPINVQSEYALSHSLNDLLNTLGVFIASDEQTGDETINVLKGLKLIILKKKSNKYNLGFELNGEFKEEKLNLKNLSKDLKNRGKVQQLESCNDLESYFTKNDIVYDLVPARRFSCKSARKMQLSPNTPGKDGIFTKLYKIKQNIQTDAELLKKHYQQMKNDENELLKVFELVIHFGEIICFGIKEPITCLKNIIPKEKQHPLTNQFLNQLKQTVNALNELVKVHTEINNESVYFMARLAVFLDKDGILSKENNLAPINFALASKFVNSNYNRAFELYSKAAEQEYLPAICAKAKCLENGLGVAQNRPLAVELYEHAKEIGDQTGIAQHSIDELKAKLNEADDLKKIGAWYASLKSNKAVDWLNRAELNGAKELDLFWGCIYQEKKDFNKAFDLYLSALKYDTAKALKAIESLDGELKANPEKHVEKISEPVILIEIAEAFKVNGQSANAANWLVRASNLGSEKALRALRNMVGKADYKDAQYIIGEFFEGNREYEKAMKCFKKSNPTNIDKQDEEIFPWDNQETEDDGYDTPNSYENLNGNEVYLPLAKQKPISIFFQNAIDYTLFARKKEQFKVFKLRFLLLNALF